MTLLEELLDKFNDDDIKEYNTMLKSLEKYNYQLYSDIKGIEQSLEKIDDKFGGIPQRAYIKDFIVNYKKMINKLMTYVDWNKEIEKDDKFTDDN